jgi:hypothetical protein
MQNTFFIKRREFTRHDFRINLKRGEQERQLGKKTKRKEKHLTNTTQATT